MLVPRFLFFTFVFTLVLTFNPSLGYAQTLENPMEELDDCSTIDVSDSFPLELQSHHDFPTDQGDIGWCFGFAAADLLGQKIGSPLSAFHIAANMMRSLPTFNASIRTMTRQSAMPEGSFLEDTIKSAIQMGKVCNPKTMNEYGTIPFSKGKNGNGGPKVLFNAFEDFRKNRCDSHCEAAFKELGAYYFADYSTAELKKYLMETKNFNLQSITFNLMQENCSKSMINLPQDIQVRSAKDENWLIGALKKGTTKPLADSKKMQAIDKALEENKVVGIELVDNLLFKKDFSRKPRLHIASIYARKKINNQCYYRVKNSWGPHACDEHLKSSLICDPMKGTFWIPKELLHRVSTKAIWID